MTMYGPVEVHSPTRICAARRRMPDDECRVAEIKLQIERMGLRRAHDERRIEADLDWNRQVRRTALRPLNVNVARIYRRSSRRTQPGFRIGGDRENHITLVAGNGESRTGVSAYRNADIPEYFTELIQLLEIDHGSRRGRGINRDGAPTTLREQRNTQHPDADSRPILRRGITDNNRHIGCLRHVGGCCSATAPAGAATARNERSGEGGGNNQLDCLIEHDRSSYAVGKPHSARPN